MRHLMIAERYAGGLSAAIEDAARLEPAMEALNHFHELLASNDGLRHFLLNPAIGAERRIELLDVALDTLEQCPDEVQRLLHLLVRRNRTQLAGAVAARFEGFADERLNRIEAAVTTAEPLTGEQAERIREALARATGKTVRIELHVDPAIIDGVVARVEGRVIDGSVRSTLEQLRATLRS